MLPLPRVAPLLLLPLVLPLLSSTARAGAQEPERVAPAPKQEEQKRQHRDEEPPGEPADPPSPEVRTFLTEWADSLRGLHTLRVRFTQTKELKVLRRPRTSTGVVLLSDRRLLMRVGDADGTPETELLVEADEVRIHYPRLQRLEVYPRAEAEKPNAPFPLMIDDVESLPRENALRLERDGALRTLVLTPRAPDSNFVEVRLSFRDGRMAAVEQRDRHGNRVRLTIGEFAVNPTDPPVDERAIRLDVPQGTKVVRFGEHEPGAAPARERNSGAAPAGEGR